MVRELKGASSHDLNQRQQHKVLEWQRGFGVVSFGMNNLDWVLEYIAHQKEHHAMGRIQDRLERTRFDDDGMPMADAYAEE